MRRKNEKQSTQRTSADVPTACVQMPAEDHERVKVAADRRGLKISAVYRQAVAMWLAANGEAAQ